MQKNKEDDPKVDRFYRKAEEVAFNEGSDEDRSYALFGRALLYFDKNHSREAIGYAQDAVKLNPKETIFQLFLGMAYDQKKKYFRADWAFKKFNKSKSNRVELREFSPNREAAYNLGEFSKGVLNFVTKELIIGLVSALIGGGLLGRYVLTNKDDTDHKNKTTKQDNPPEATSETNEIERGETEREDVSETDASEIGEGGQKEQNKKRMD